MGDPPGRSWREVSLGLAWWMSLATSWLTQKRVTVNHMVKGRYKNGEENLRHSPKQVKQVKHFDYQDSCEDVQKHMQHNLAILIMFLEWQTDVGP